MKTENFDQALKDKLQSMDFVSTDAEINAVHQFVRAHTTPVYMRPRFTYAVAAASALVVVSLLYWNLSMMEEKSSMNKKIEQLTKDLENKVKIESPQASAPVEAINPSLINKEQSSFSGTILYSQTPSHTASEKHSQNYISKTTNSTKIAPEVIRSGTSQVIGNSDKPVPVHSFHDSIPELPNSGIENQHNNISMGKEELNEAPDSALSHKDDITQKNIRNPKKVMSPKKEVQLGIAFENGKHSGSKGFQANMALTKNWMIGMGLKWMSVREPRFGDPHDFKNKRGIEFGQMYQNNISDTNNISGIRIESNVLQVPLSVAYRLPLKRSYSLILNAGADIDVHAYQEVTYSRSAGMLGEQKNDFHVETPVTLINNAFAGVAVNKQIKKFVLDAGMLASIPTAQVVYKANGPALGFRFRLLYQIN